MEGLKKNHYFHLACWGCRALKKLLVGNSKLQLYLPVEGGNMQVHENIHARACQPGDVPRGLAGGRRSRTAICSCFNLKALHYFMLVLLGDSRSINKGEC